MNMSYCAFENTSGNIRQLLGMMENAESVEDMRFNNSEARAFKQMLEQAELLRDEIERLLEFNS